MSEDNLWRKIERYFRPWMMVAVFIIVLLFGFCRESKAETAVTAEIGPTFLSGEFSKGAGLMVHQTWDEKWRIGMGVTSKQGVVPRTEPFTEVRQNLMVHGQRVVAISDSWKLGLGVAYWNAKTRWNGTSFTASMSIEYHINDKWDVKWRHFSNAGSAAPNMGQDMLVVGYTF
jgi:hypothetical protein